MQRLAQRSALITGASAGIGAATARALAAEGARVTLAARRRDRLEALAADLEGASVLVLDVTDGEAVQEALGDTTFDIVLANAGLGLGLASLQEGELSDWSQMIDTNVKGVLHVVRATLPAMLAAGKGDVVLLGSVAGRQVYPGGNVYCATKHAVHGIYQSLREDAGGQGVRFTTVDPGMVETDFSLVRFEGDADRAKEVYQGMNPLTPADVADAVRYAVTRPPHMNVGEIVLWPTDQISTRRVNRRD